MKLELTKWKEDAKRAKESWDINYTMWKPTSLIEIHESNACPQNFIKLIECYEFLLEESVMMDERVEKLEEALKSLKYGCDEKCWCDVSIGNPMMRGHSDNCIAITKLLE